MPSQPSMAGTAGGADRSLFNCLTPPQALQHLRAMAMLRGAPNQWTSLRQLDDALAEGPRLSHFPDEWLDELYRSASHPRAALELFVSIAPRTKGCQVKPENRTSSGGFAETHPVVCTSRSDPARPYRPCGHPTVSAAIRATHLAAVGGGVDVDNVDIELRHVTVEVASVEDVVQAVEATSSGDTGRVGLATGHIYADEGGVARRCITEAVASNRVYGIAASGGAGGARRAQIRRRQEGGTRGGADDGGDADVATAGETGALLGAVEADVQINFNAWHAAAPVQFVHHRVVDGVKMEGSGLPTVLQVGDPPVTVAASRRPGTPARRLCVRLHLSATGKAAHLVVEPQELLLDATDDERRFEIRAEGPGRGNISITIVDRDTQKQSTPGTRTYTCVATPAITLERTKPYVLFHRGTEANNLFSAVGLRLPPEVGPVCRLLSAPPHLAGTMHRLDPPSSAELQAVEERLVQVVPSMIQSETAAARRNVRSNLMVSSSSSDDDGNAAGNKAPGSANVSAAQRSYDAKYMSNRHMLPLGVDLRRPYRPEPDPSVVVLRPLSDRAYSRS